MSRLDILSVNTKINCWTVIKQLPRRKYLCKCNCGITQELRAFDLIRGKSKMCRSCGLSVAKKGHGASSKAERDLTYSSWMHMISRCYNVLNKDYKNYGARGIEVCQEWLDSYESFLMAMGSCPGPGFTIDRIRVNGNYEPDNCKWSTTEEQNKNKRSNIRITLDEDTKVLSDWIKEKGITNGNTFYKRISRFPEDQQIDLAIEFKKFLINGAKYE